jgi:hypothetical protein
MSFMFVSQDEIDRRAQINAKKRAQIKHFFLGCGHGE